MNPLKRVNIDFVIVDKDDTIVTSSKLTALSKTKLNKNKLTGNFNVQKLLPDYSPVNHTTYIVRKVDSDEYYLEYPKKDIKELNEKIRNQRKISALGSVALATLIAAKLLIKNKKGEDNGD